MGRRKKLRRHQNKSVIKTSVEACKQAIRIDPGFAMAHLRLGVVYAELGRYQEAIDACKQAIRIDPGNAEAHFTLGMVYVKLGNKESALNQHRILMDIDRELANRLFDQINK